LTGELETFWHKRKASKKASSLSFNYQSYITPSHRLLLDTSLFFRSYSNAKPDDLFAEWQKVSKGVLPEGLNFTDIAIGWTEQDGVPVVTAIRNYENGEITFTQERYYDVKPTCACDYKRSWWIPLTWTHEAENNPHYDFVPQAWLKGNMTDEKLVVKTDISPKEWLLLNPRSIGEFLAFLLGKGITIQSSIHPHTYEL